MIALSDIEIKIGPFRKEVSAVVEIPEPSLRLNLKSRGGRRVAEFKHLHQMCTLHALNFIQSNRVKTVALIDGYIETCRAKNPLGPYLFARSLLELAAFLNDVSSRLLAIQAKDDAAWRARGEEFFGTVVRARFASSDQAKVAVFKDLAKDHAKPFNVTASMRLLAERPETAALASHYDSLCDYVHHNLSSQIASSRGVKIGSYAQFNNAAFITSKSMAITRYEYPLINKGELAMQSTLEIVDQVTAVCFNSLITLPTSPYSERQILQEAGSVYGLPRLA